MTGLRAIAEAALDPDPLAVWEPEPVAAPDRRRAAVNAAFWLVLVALGAGIAWLLWRVK